MYIDIEIAITAVVGRVGDQLSVGTDAGRGRESWIGPHLLFTSFVRDSLHHARRPV